MPSVRNLLIVGSGAAGCAAAILFAREDLDFPADGPWLSGLRQPTPVSESPAFADIPAGGQRIARGRPILTLFAHAGALRPARV